MFFSRARQINTGNPAVALASSKSLPAAPVMDTIRALEIKAPYEIAGLDKPYDKDDSYHLLATVISQLKPLVANDNSADDNALKSILSILETNYQQATDLLAVRGQVITDLAYAMLNPMNWLSASKIIAKSTKEKVVPQMAAMQEEGGKLRDIPICGQKSFLALSLVMECIRRRSQGYQLNKECDALETSPLKGTSEEWTQINVIDMNQQRLIARNLFEDIRAKILESLKANIFTGNDKGIIETKLKQQNELLVDLEGQMLSDVNNAIARLKLRQFSKQNNISLLQKKLQFCDDLSTHLKNFESIPGITPEALKHLIGEKMGITQTVGDLKIEKLLKVDSDSDNTATKLATNLRQAAFGLKASTYASRVRKRIAEARGPIVVTLKEKAEEVKKIESLIDQLTTIRKDLKGKWFSREKRSELKELIKEVSKAYNLKEYDMYITTAQSTLEHHRTSYLFRSWVTPTKKDELPSSYTKFNEWNSAQQSQTAKNTHS